MKSTPSWVPAAWAKSRAQRISASDATSRLRSCRKSSRPIGAETDGLATISAMVHTVSVSCAGKVRLERVDVAHDTGFGLVNPLSVKKQIEGQIV